jgi:hypothetical protein
MVTSKTTKSNGSGLGFEAQLSANKGRVFDPCCGSGDMFVPSEKHAGRAAESLAFGQIKLQRPAGKVDARKTITWKPAPMSIAAYGAEARLLSYKR